MKVLFLNTELKFSLIPRTFPLLIDNLVLNLRNEITNVELNPSITFTITDKLNIIIASQPSDFKSQNKYEIELKNGTDVIYLGKLLILEQGTNVQNYEYGSQTKTRFDYK